MEEDILQRIEVALDKYVRPQLSEHYGDVQVLSFKNGILNVKMLGHCSNCPSAKYTVEAVIEGELTKHIPEVEKVFLIESINNDLLEFARKLLHHEGM